MGFFDSLFGGGKKAEAPKAKPKKAKAPATDATEAPVAPAGGLTPEIIAAVSASVGMVMERASAEMVAAITAAIVHARGGGVSAVRFKRASNAWAASGRQKIMDGRQFNQSLKKSK